MHHIRAHKTLYSRLATRLLPWTKKSTYATLNPIHQPPMHYYELLNEAVMDSIHRHEDEPSEIGFGIYGFDYKSAIQFKILHYKTQYHVHIPAFLQTDQHIKLYQHLHLQPHLKRASRGIMRLCTVTEQGKDILKHDMSISFYAIPVKVTIGALVHPAKEREWEFAHECDYRPHGTYLHGVWESLYQLFEQEADKIRALPVEDEDEIYEAIVQFNDMVRAGFELVIASHLLVGADSMAEHTALLYRTDYSKVSEKRMLRTIHKYSSTMNENDVSDLVHRVFSTHSHKLREGKTGEVRDFVAHAINYSLNSIPNRRFIMCYDEPWALHDRLLGFLLHDDWTVRGKAFNLETLKKEANGGVGDGYREKADLLHVFKSVLGDFLNVGLEQLVIDNEPRSKYHWPMDWECEGRDPKYGNQDFWRTKFEFLPTFFNERFSWLGEKGEEWKELGVNTEKVRAKGKPYWVSRMYAAHLLNMEMNKERQKTLNGLVDSAKGLKLEEKVLKMVTSVDQRSALVSNVLALDRSGEFLAVLNYINRMPPLISQLLAIEHRSKMELYGVAQLLCMYSEECKRVLFNFCDHAQKTQSNILQTIGKVSLFCQ